MKTVMIKTILKHKKQELMPTIRLKGKNENKNKQNIKEK
jgi:hypothetical protein